MIIYHVAGLEKLVWAVLAERGLSDVLDQRGTLQTSVGHTVDGERGGVFCQGVVTPNQIGEAAWQSLREITGKAEHEGVSIAAVGETTEAWLRRSRFYGGPKVALAGGLTLYVPVFSALPGVIRMQGGAMAERLTDPRALHAKQLWADCYTSATGGVVTFPTLPLAEAILAINYRATWAEWTVLQAIQRDDAARIFELATDIKTRDLTEQGQNPTEPS